MVYLCCSSQNQGHKWVVHNFLYRLPWIPIFSWRTLFRWKPRDFHGNHVITKPKLQNSDSHARFLFVGKLVCYGIPWFATWFPNFPWMSSISARSRVVLFIFLFINKFFLPPQRHPQAQSQGQISGSTSTEPVQVVLVLDPRLVLARWEEFCNQ